LAAEYIYLGKDAKHLVLKPGESATANIRQLHRFANDRDEPVIFTINTEPAGGVVKAFQLAYVIANDGGAARDGLPSIPIARLVFVKTTQGHLPGIPLVLQRIVFAVAAAFVTRVFGLEKTWQVYFINNWLNAT
jgi:hypothetical protein